MREVQNEAHFREMAAKCRRLAASTDDPRAIDSLRKLADQYEEAAEAAATAGSFHPRLNGKSGPPL
ncbi:MAG TPA: hypothetical protein VE820_12490 [Sphingomicrobium sp.]|nr:hypothetical protein [Sphingomicrobium sp.]